MISDNQILLTECQPSQYNEEAFAFTIDHFFHRGKDS